MNTTIRRIAVSGAAAVALLGSAAATATAATAEHEATIVAIAQTDTQDPAGITTGITTDGGQGAMLQNPVNNPQPAGYNQQIRTQASGGAIAGGVVAILLLGFVVFVRVKHRDIKIGDAVVVTLFGIAVSGTVIGGLGDQLTNSAIGALGGVLGGL